MKLPFLSKSSIETTTSNSPWPWGTCGNPKTLSFRATSNEILFKTRNMDMNIINPSSLTNSVMESEPELAIIGDDSIEIETVIKGLNSERLFFEADESSSILEDAKKTDKVLFKESVAMSMDSNDPVVDFRQSMEEMVEAHSLKDWECLEEMLSSYLRVNGKSNHGFIVTAFVDLLVHLSTFSASSSSSSSSHASTSYDHCSSTTPSFTSPLSFSSSTSTTTTSYTSPCLSSLLAEDETEKSMDNVSSSSSLSG